MKKQIAVLMAAATAVTTVAPVLANAEVKNEKMPVSQVNKKIKEALDTKYKVNTQDGINKVPGAPLTGDNEYKNSRYAVLISIEGMDAQTDDPIDGTIKRGNSLYNGILFDGVDLNDVENKKLYVVTDISKATNKIESLVAKNKKIVAYIVDKGIDKDGNSTFKTTKALYSDLADLEAERNEIYGLAAGPIVQKYLEQAGVGNVKKAEGTFELKLKNEKKIEISINDPKVDVNKPVDSKGNVLDFVNNPDADLYKEVVGFKAKDDLEEEAYVDVKNGDTTVYTVSESMRKVVDASKLYSAETGYTKEGVDFVNKFVNAKKDPYSFNYDGVHYKLRYNNLKPNDALQAEKALGLKDETPNPIVTVKKSGDKYLFEFSATVVDGNDTEVIKEITFVVEGGNQKDVATILKDIYGDNEVVEGRFKKLSGSNRYGTAIEISKETFKADGPGTYADSVVIVGGKALMDGLAAGPIAAANNASILLADPMKGLDKETLDEIGRATDSNLKNKVVYIVGGDSSVPKNVETQLKEKFGAVVVRLSGKNRFDTSLEVLRRMKHDGKISTVVDAHDVFFVGGDGAADAMSAAGVASSKLRKVRDVISPIVVVPKDGVDRRTRDELKGYNFKEAFVVGGTSTLSTSAFKNLSIATPNIERISGANRFATNEKLIKKFYNKDNTVNGKIETKGLLVASGKDQALVDAQTSAILSAKNGYPVVLGDSKLTKEQLKLMTGNEALAGVNKNVYQIGGAVSADVMKSVVDKLGL